MTRPLPPLCHNEILNGIELLLAVRLRWAPTKTDDIERVGAAWLVAAAAAKVYWDDSRDPPRIRAAFASLTGTVRDWPAPADMLAALPVLRPPLALAYKRPPPTPEQRKKAAEIMQQIKALVRTCALDNATTQEKSHGA